MAKCKVCKMPDAKFKHPARLMWTCSHDCSAKLAIQLFEKKKSQEAKEERRKDKNKLEELNNTIKHWRPKAQKMFNRWVRLRDKDQPCISCGRHEVEIRHNDFRAGKWDAGHYRSTGACPELRFEPLNCHRQCIYCNRDLSGNAIEYRIRLVDRIGKDKVDWLELNHDLPKMKVDDYKRVYEEYRIKVKELEGEQ